MSRKETPETRLGTAYRKTFATTFSANVLADLVLFAQDEKDSAVRAGRLDVIARIMRQCGKRIPEASSVYEEGS